VPLSKTGAELLFEMLSQRYERGSTLVTSNLPFQEWTEVLGSERLTGALLDRLRIVTIHSRSRRMAIPCFLIATTARGKPLWFRIGSMDAGRRHNMQVSLAAG